MPPVKAIREQWHEDKNSLNQHDAGAASITLDQVTRKQRTNGYLQIRKRIPFILKPIIMA
ncbi:hypothetical protein ABID99_002502 [Mucilaginibacter sp. OAE612]|uniref:hypothetical protein n=1 Tax=Mucilaginibacter sp. OAE612 TaxID=3156444 RepID=UPI00359D795B